MWMRVWEKGVGLFEVYALLSMEWAYGPRPQEVQYNWVWRKPPWGIMVCNN